MPPKRDSQIHLNNSSSGANHHQHNHQQQQHQQQQQQHQHINRQTSECNNNSIGATLRVRTIPGNSSTNGALSSSSPINANHDNMDWVNEQRQQQYQVNAKLCRLVKKCPWMYDRHHANYAKKSILDKSWAKIARDCDESVASCKERWRNIRAAFARSINIYKTHGGPNRVKPYYLHAELGFLVKPMMEGRDKLRYDDAVDDGRELDEPAAIESEADVESNELADSKELSEQDDASATTIEEKDKTVEEHHNNFEPEMAINSDDENEIIFNHDSRQKTQNGKPTTPQQHHAATAATTTTIPMPQITQYHTEPTRRQKCCHYNPFGNDPDAKFLEALLPDLRAMNARQKIVFKRKIYQSIEEVMEMATASAMPIVSNPSTDTIPHYTPNNAAMNMNANVERTHVLHQVYNMADDEVQRLNAYLQQNQRSPATLSTSQVTAVTNGHAPPPPPPQTPLTIIPRAMPRKRHATNTPSMPPTINTKVPRPEAPWDQIVPIVVKEELDDVDIE